MAGHSGSRGSGRRVSLLGLILSTLCVGGLFLAPLPVAAESGRVTQQPPSQGRLSKHEPNDKGIQVTQEDSSLSREQEPSSLSRDMSALTELSRNLRGGSKAPRPEEVVPELHRVVESQLRRMKSFFKLHIDGEEAALASSIRSFLRQTEDVAIPSEEETKELAGVEFVRDVSDYTLDYGSISDSEIIELFDPDDLYVYVDQLQSLSELLEDVKSLLLQDPDMLQANAQGGTGERVNSVKESERDENGQIRADSRAQRHLGEDGEGYTLPPVCTDGCAPDQWDCLCQRLANCTSRMSHFDLSVLFANGYIETDLGSSKYGGLTADLSLFNVGENAYATFNSILAMARDINDSQSPTREACDNLLEQFHQSCDPVSNETCSGANVQTFQLSVDEVCENVHSPTKLFAEAIGGAFDGYESPDGKSVAFDAPLMQVPTSTSLSGFASYTTSCAAERVAFEVCQNFIDDFELLYAGRNTSVYPNPNPMRTDPNVPVDASNGVVLFPTQYKFEQDDFGVATLAFTPSYHNETQYCDEVQVYECIDRCFLRFMNDTTNSNANYCSQACSGDGEEQVSPCTVEVSQRYDMCSTGCASSSVVAADVDKCLVGCEFWDIKVRVQIYASGAEFVGSTDCMGRGQARSQGYDLEVMDCDQAEVFNFDPSTHQIQLGAGKTYSLGKC